MHGKGTLLVVDVLGDTLRASDGDPLGASHGDMLGTPARAMWEPKKAMRPTLGLVCNRSRDVVGDEHRFGSRTTPSMSRRRWRRF
jgi:hypothetical protein